MRRDVFQAIANPTRRDILMLIASQAMTPNALADHFDSSLQAVSKHIKIMTECKIIKHKKKGRKISYYFNPKKMKEVDSWLKHFRALWESRIHKLDVVIRNVKNKKKKS